MRRKIIVNNVILDSLLFVLYVLDIIFYHTNIEQ